MACFRVMNISSKDVKGKPCMSGFTSEKRKVIVNPIDKAP
jgi:hypothetical protein